MRILKNFECQKYGTVFERLVQTPTPLMTVCNCGADATRVITAPKFLGNSTGGNASFKQKRV